MSDFLGGLCKRTGQSPYCGTKSNFDTYLKQPPTLALRTMRVRGGATRKLTLLAVEDLARTASSSRAAARRRVALGGAARPRPGRRDLGPPAGAGTYQVRLSAVDLAGNAGSAEGTVEVVAPKKKRKRSRN